MAYTIGRTGRAGNKGHAISFFDEDMDGGRAKELIKVLKDAKQEVPPQLLTVKSSGRGKRNSRGKYYGGFGFGKRRGRW